MLNHSKMIVMSGAFTMSFILSSCFVPAEQSLVESPSDSQVSNINVTAQVATPWSQTRSGDVVPEPICYYLFDSDNSCIEMKKADLASSAVGFEVERGTYTIYALCGMASGYPTKDNVDPSGFITCAACSDICVGKADVTVSKYGEKKSLVVSVDHVFAKMALTLTDVPETVTGITVQFGDLSTQFSLSGTYSGKATSEEFSLSSSASATTTWELAETLLYPSASKDVLPITLKISSDDNSEQTIQTTTDVLAKKGVRTHLSAQFSAMSTINSSVQVGNNWTDETGNLDLEENSQTGSPTSDPVAPTTPSTTSYKVKDQFEDTGAIIIDIIKENDVPKELVLLGTTIAFTGNNKNTENYMIGKLTDYDTKVGTQNYNLSWRIPTETELNNVARNLYQNPSELNSFAQTINSTNAFTLDENSNIFFKDNGTIRVLNYQTGSWSTADKDILFIPVANYQLK